MRVLSYDPDCTIQQERNESDRFNLKKPQLKAEMSMERVLTISGTYFEDTYIFKNGNCDQELERLTSRGSIKTGDKATDVKDMSYGANGFELVPAKNKNLWNIDFMIDE